MITETFSYLVACFVMGIGIAADVAMATLAMSYYITSTSAKIWVRRITATHVLFPMIGYYSFVFLVRNAGQLILLLGIFAASFIGWFLFELIKEWISEDNEEEASHTNWYGWPLVLAVSYDALYSGPAKSAQAISWSTLEVFASFFIAGFFVFLVAVLASLIALRFHRLIQTGNFHDGILSTASLRFIEFSILLYFCMLSIDRYVLETFYSPVSIMLSAFFITLILFSAIWKKMFPTRR